MIRSSFLLYFLVAMFVACGGSGTPAPKPLKLHYDDVYIAQFSLDEKAEILEAQNAYHRARAEQMKAESEQKEIKTQIAVAKNERKQALLAEESAKQEVKAAEDSGDMNRVNAAQRNLRVTELERRAADERIDALNARKKYLTKYVHYTTEETYHRESRFELAKAKLGKKKNIAPKGFKYDEYQKQSEDRSRKAQKANHVSKQEEQKAATKMKAWEARKKEADKARGGSGASASDTTDSVD